MDGKIKKISYIIPFFMVGGVEIYKQIHIAVVIESVGEDRSKNGK